MRGSLLVAGAAMGQLLSLSVGGAAPRAAGAPGTGWRPGGHGDPAAGWGLDGPLPDSVVVTSVARVSSLWTPGGERPVSRESRTPEPEPPEGEELTPEEQAQLAEQMAAVQQELLGTPVSVVVANHAVGLFQLAALHLNQRPPDLEEGRLAVDAMGALVEGLSGRLGEEEASLKEALAQLRMAFVQLQRETGGE